MKTFRAHKSWQVLAPAAFALALATSAGAQQQQDPLHRSHNGGNTTLHEITYPSGKTFYNFDVYLTPRNTSLEMVVSSGRARSHPPKEGYFEVYVDKVDLPVTAESCAGSKVIVAMPWGGTDPRSRKNVQRNQLYNRISRLMRRGQGRIRVVLESNPDFTKALVAPVRGSSVRQLDLSSCKLYFRTYRGNIVSSAGLLKN